MVGFAVQPGSRLPFLSGASPSLVQEEIRHFLQRQGVMPKKKRAGSQPRKADPRKNPHNFVVLPPQTVAQGLSRKLFTPLGRYRPRPPAQKCSWRGHRVLSAGRGPGDAEGTLSPSRSLAASPSYKTYGWVLKKEHLPGVGPASSPPGPRPSLRISLRRAATLPPLADSLPGPVRRGPGA